MSQKDHELFLKTLRQMVNFHHVRPQDKKKKIPLLSKQRLTNYYWSSHQEYLGRRNPPDWLSMEWLTLWGDNKKKAYREIHYCPVV